MESNTNSDSFSNNPHFSKMRSSGLLVEYRHPSAALSKDLAAHIASRYAEGKIAVVTSHPHALIGAVRKQWLRLIRLAQRDRSSTLNPLRKDNLDKAIHGMRSVGFTIKSPEDEPLARVSFATVEQLVANPPSCATLYITEPVGKLNRHMLATWMPPGGVVVVYDE
jgi:hypothetical protein